MKDELATKEIIRITKKDTAYSQLEDERHSARDYIVEKDEIGKEGKRVLVLAPRPMEDIIQKRKEVVQTILKKLGESRSKTLKKLLTDVFSDYFPESIERLHDSIVAKDKPVKQVEGCFKLIVGDGRRKDSEEIMLRD